MDERGMPYLFDPIRVITQKLPKVIRDTLRKIPQYGASVLLGFSAELNPPIQLRRQGVLVSQEVVNGGRQACEIV